MQQVARVLTRTRTLLFCHSPVSRRRGVFSTPGLPNDLHMVKVGHHDPYFPRHFLLAAGCQYTPLKWLQRLHLTTADAGRRSGLIVGLVVGTGYLCRKEGRADIAHCENGQTSKGPTSTEVVEWDYRRSQLGRVVKKLWVPSLCVLTISLGWHYPVSLLLNLLFLMWSTKPSPASIYMWVEQMRQQDALQLRGLDRMKAQAAGVMHVEVRDNMLFCLAKVTSLTKRSTLVGFLGDWWVIYSSSSAIHTGVNLRNLIPAVGPFSREQFN